MPRLLTILAAAALLAGCTTARETFPGYEADHVWSAMVAAAETPDYDHHDPSKRWTVKENAVWVDQRADRLEIYRRLIRHLHEPYQPVQKQDRTWRFRVTLEEAGPVPTATFISRDPAVPAHVWEEAGRYFDDVWQILGGRPEAPPGGAQAGATQ